MKFASYLVNSCRYIVPEHLVRREFVQAPLELPPTAISKLPDFQTPPQNQAYLYSQPLQLALNGRKLLLQEIPFPIELLHQHYLHGYISYHKALIEKNGNPFCQRCGNQKRHLFASHHCARCTEQCMYCRHCITMGKVAQCTPLITWTGPVIKYETKDRVLHWQGTLSPGQQYASEKIVAAIGESCFHSKKSDKTSDQNLATKILVWAVCGSGKTEILFEGINKAIQLGQIVLIATPRSDVVHELTPRLKAVFENVSIVSLFGGSEDRGKEGQLVITTTHQLLRYEQHFDLVIIDEVDAFPFSYDPMLKYATKNAAKPQATTILLTATPDKKLQKSRDLEIIKIPKRYHGFPLPIPKLKWSGNWRKLLQKKRVPATIIAWITKKAASKQQAFIFVPSVIVLTQLVPLLQQHFPFLEGVHAEDPNRREKVQKFRNGEIQLLVTTTILERGVTVPNIAVAVYGADDDVFTESALVQISGRVGRSATFPTGEIIFFHYGKTEAMLDAIDHLKQMNKMGGF